MPFWAIPLGIFLLELANRNRMRKSFMQAWTAFIVAIILFLMSAAFMYFGGYNSVEPFVQSITSFGS